jgi:2-polyprenyl-3-methyl-5-hydroxy-6-metoxy-1,4-benzoquinol methylase
MKASGVPDRPLGDQQRPAFDEAYFRSWNYESVNFGRFSQYWWARRYYATLVRRYQRSGRLLEIGCGLGHLLSRLEDRFETYGIDVSEFAIERARETAPRSRLQVLEAERIDSFGPAFFDAVVGLHLIEHLEQPEAVLQKCAYISRPGALLLLATPNLRAPFIRLKGAEWHGYKDPTHINMKKPEEWHDLIEACGYRVLKIFSDGLWNVPYLPWIPPKLQLLVFGLPATLQVILGGTFNPVRLGENAVIVARREAAGAEGASDCLKEQHGGGAS